MENLKQKIDEIVATGKCMGLSMLKNTLNVSELEICRALDKKDCTLLEGSEFDRVWDFLCRFEKLTFFIEKEGNIFELGVSVAPGREGMGYFNLFGAGSLNGHLKKESVCKIALLKLPFMHLVSYQIAFIGKDGNAIYNFYLSRYEHKHREQDLKTFDDFLNEAA